MGPVTIESIVEILKKHGVWAIVAVMLNARLSAVEERLYDCYEDQISMSSPMPMSDKKIYQPEKIYAVLPSKCKSVKECLS